MTRKILLTLFLLAALLAGFSGLGMPAQAGSEYVLARIYFSSPAELNDLASRLDVWEVHASEGWLLAYLPSARLAELQASGMKAELDQFAASRLPAPILKPSAPLAGIPGFACYRTVLETEARLVQLATQYPTLAQRIDIGDSWEKTTSGGTSGSDLWVLKLTNQAIPGPKPKFFLMAAIHARELVTAETALRFAEMLLGNYGTNPDITWLLDDYEIHILPQANPDGRKKAETGLLWRKNTDSAGCGDPNAWGVDLNRNSSFHWGGAGSSSDACNLIYHGPMAASEPEVQAVQSYITSLFPDRRGPADSDPAPLDYEGLVVSLHSYSGLVLWPYGFTSSSTAPNGAQLQTLGRKMAYYNHYTPQQASMLYLTTGSTDDWSYGTLGVPSFTIEMGTDFFQDCASYESTIYPANRDALLSAFKVTRRPYQLPAGPEVTFVQITPASAPAQTALTLAATADDTRFSTANGTEPTQIIQAGRYSIDSPSWIAGATLLPMSLGSNPANPKILTIFATLNTGTLSPGRYTVFVEGQDQAGNWGAPSASFLEISPTRLVQAAADGVKASRPGTTIQHTITITNTGNLADTYTLSALSTPAWAASLPSATPLLQPGQTVEITVSITIPAGVSGPASATTQVTAESQASPSIKATATFRTDARWNVFFSTLRK